VTTCQHCGEPLMRADSAWTDLGGQTYCGDGVTRHDVANTTVVTASPTLGWLQTGRYVDQWGRTS
jgi:hypothetical protein